jgi:small-conductance mechanosensitive channel
MESVFQQLDPALPDFFARVYGYISQPWFLYQILIIGALYAAAKLIGGRLENRLEERARQIKGHPGVLRMVIALMRRVNWLLFALFLYIAVVVMRLATWPSRSYLLTVVLPLVLAWVLVSVMSRIVRQRMIARGLAILAWLYAAVVILGIQDEAAAFLDDIAISVGTFRLTALLAIKAFVLLAFAIWASVMTGNYIEERVGRYEELSPSLRVLTGKVVKIGLVALAILASVSAIGVDLTALTIFSGAVGVGIGFGLQKVVSNFVSGIIILLDKSIKPGDTISLGDTFGWIRELRARFVSVITRDGREYLIPNEDFVTQQVINWSFSDELVRLDVGFGVSYDSDPHQVSALAIEAAMSVGRVDANRRPVCWMTAFGESSLDFVVRFWIRDPQQGLTNIRGKVLLALWDSFREHNIAIPYPHREILFKEGMPPLAVPQGRQKQPARPGKRRSSTRSSES